MVAADAATAIVITQSAVMEILSCGLLAHDRSGSENLFRMTGGKKPKNHAVMGCPRHPVEDLARCDQLEYPPRLTICGSSAFPDIGQ